MKDLKYADNDAQDLYQVLLSSANWKAENIQLLLNDKATASAIYSDIYDMRSKADSDDVCLFFFAGHGGTADKDYPPRDELDGFDEFIGAYDLDILDDDLARWMDDLPTPKYVVLIDACRSGEDENPTSDVFFLNNLRNLKGTGNIVSMKGDGFAEDIAANFGSNSEISIRDFDDNKYDQGVVIAACESDQNSITLSYSENGLFTYYLLQGMAGPADKDGNGWISAEECYNYVRPRAEYIDPRNQGDETEVQHAKMYDGHPGELDFLQLPNCVQTINSFESGIFGPPWKHSGNAYWSIVNDDKPFGVNCAKSGAISDVGNSTLELTWNFPDNGYITFWRKDSSEFYSDQLKFLIDGQLAGIWSGDGDLPDEGWAKVGFPVSAGPHVLRWIYSKDYIRSEGYDRAWIDDINFRYSCQCPLNTPSLKDEPSTTLGTSNTISWNSVLGANMYYAQCSLSPNFSYIDKSSGWINNKTDYTFTGLSKGLTYYYWVKAFVGETWVQTSKPDFDPNGLIDTTVKDEGKVELSTFTSGTPVTKTVGSKSTPYNKSEQTNLVAYYCNKPCTLTQIKMHLNIQYGNSVETQFLVYESYTKSGPYKQIFAEPKIIWGQGDAPYSSESIAVSLEPSRYYLIGAAWKEAVTCYIGYGNSAFAFGSAFGNLSYSTYPPPDILHAKPQDSSFLYYQEIITEPKKYVYSGSIVSTQIDLPDGCNWGKVEFNATTLQGTTSLTVDILNDWDDNPIIHEVPSGRDISGLGLPAIIRLKANLSTTNQNITPSLNDWSVTKVSCESDWSNVTCSKQN